MKLRWIALVLVALAAVALVFHYPQAQSALFTPAASLSKEAAEVYEPHAITYVDPQRGFSVRYPKGYVAESMEGQAFVFYAPAPSGFSESFIVSALNESYSLEEMQAAVLDEFDDANKTSQSDVLVNGKRAPRLQYVVPTGTEDMHLVQSLVPCGNYSLYYLATIPDSVKEDLGLADYVLQSLAC